MAWVRIHDGAMGNLKILRLSDSAFRLWVKGLSYCQTHLTDGLIPREWLHETRAKRGDVEMLSSVLVENKSPLWETIDGFGFKCHDYLTWNDCREKVMERQDDAKRRKADYDARKKAERAAKRADTEQRSERVQNSVRNASENASITKPNQTNTFVRPPKRGNGQPPLAMGLQRVKVWRWMMESFTQALGPYAEDFRLDLWVQDVDTRETRVIVTDDWWSYWQSQFAREVADRHLPIATPDAPLHASKQTKNLAAALGELDG